MNNQPRTEPFVPHPKGALVVHKVFRTIQGEGPFAGEPAVFVRLAGCNLQCPGCDTDYTGGELVHPVELVEHVRSLLPPVRCVSPEELVVITGGEPLAQYLGPAVIALLDGGFRVQVETNGTLYVPAPWARVTVVCSPKAPKVHPQLAPFVQAYKYVLAADGIDPKDGLPSEVLGAPVRPARPPRYFGGKVYVQPADQHHPQLNEENRQAVVDVCMKFGYTLGIQLHKLLNLE